MWNVTASFRSCQDPWPAQSAGAVSIETYTNVTCPCPAGAGDITYKIHLPSESEPFDYKNLNETPNPDFLNAHRCANEFNKSVDDQIYPYCIRFTNIPKAREVNGTELMVEVTPDPFSANSSTSCIIIVVQGTNP